jgi:hypothetical protein
MAPQFVKPYVKTNKNDAADAEAICEAVSRPSMRFVAIKTSDQQVLPSAPIPHALRKFIRLTYQCEVRLPRTHVFHTAQVGFANSPINVE